MKYRVNVTANDDGSKNWFDQAITPIMEAMEIAGLIKSPAAWSLRHYRERLGLTQDNVARAVGITPSNYARLERGDADLRKMSFGNAIRLANTLRITPDELFDCAGRV